LLIATTTKEIKKAIENKKKRKRNINYIDIIKALQLSIKKIE